MSIKEFDFDFVERVSKVTQRHVVRETTLHVAWADVVEATRPAIGRAIAKAVLALPIADGLVTCTARYAALLARDNAGPAKRVNSLWFGIANLLPAGTDAGVMTPYICGSVNFDPDDCDWPCDPAWFPDDAYAPNEPMTMLSVLGERHGRRSYYIDTCLIEPLHRLYVAHFARACPSQLLLGKAKFRGIGCGFDSGDLITIGTVDSNGLTLLKNR